jgi:hypothetical protein
MWNVVILDLATILQPEIVFSKNDSGVEVHLVIVKGEAGAALV